MPEAGSYLGGWGMIMTFVLLFVLTALFVIAGGIIAKKRGMIIALVIALIMNFTTYWFSDSIVLGMYGAHKAPSNHRLVRIVNELSLESGLPAPAVYIIPSPSPNAFATGRNPDHAAVAATEGILHILNDAELKGVMAHELGHVKNYDTLTGTVAASISGAMMILSRMALFFGGNDRASIGKRLAVAVLAPLAATVVTLAISRDREYAADEFSGTLTRRPGDLAAALLKLERGVRAVPMNDSRPETAHLFIVHPFSGSSIGEVFATHPPIQKRVARLMELQKKLKR